MKKIILIVGASGVGKDSLIREAKKELKEGFNFVKRYITREPDTNEQNYFVENSAFKLLKESNYFISSWEAHGNFYGVSKDSIEDKVNVLSVSRSKIADFEKNFDEVYTINITLDKEELKNRLLRRGRESIYNIQKRLDRSYDKVEARNLINFENNRPFGESIEAFIELLKKIYEI